MTVCSKARSSSALDARWSQFHGTLLLVRPVRTLLLEQRRLQPELLLASKTTH